MEPRCLCPTLSSPPPHKLSVEADLSLLEEDWRRFLPGAVSASPGTALWRCCWVTRNTFSPDRISEPSLHTAQLPPPPALSMWLKRYAGLGSWNSTGSLFPCLLLTEELRENFHSLHCSVFGTRTGTVSLWPFLLCLSISILWKHRDCPVLCPACKGIERNVLPDAILLCPQFSHQVFCRGEKMMVVVSPS